MGTGRYINNPHRDYSGENLFSKDGLSLEESIQNRIKERLRVLFGYWEQSAITKTDYSDTSVYTGSAGMVLLYLKIYESKVFENSQVYLEKAANLIQQILKSYHKIRVPTFLCGEVGLLTAGALVHYHLGRDYLYFIQQIVSILDSICNVEDSNLPDELLYGRSGYLYSLLLIRSKIETSNSLITNEMIRKVMSAILKSGMEKSKQFHQSEPLFYFWYNEPYIGAAHGYAGILTMLLQTPDLLTQDELNDLVKPTIEYIYGYRFRNTGNYPACIGDTDDILAHWCHGSPGVIYLLALAYQTFNEQKYLQSAIQSADDIWRRGLLVKGYGLCHGASGNGYSFLRMFTLTKEPKYLHRAVKFADWCCDHGKHGCRIPDTPYSLFEGMAGTIYFLIDILQPHQAMFPGFQLK